MAHREAGRDPPPEVLFRSRRIEADVEVTDLVQCIPSNRDRRHSDRTRHHSLQTVFDRRLRGIEWNRVGGVAKRQ